MARSKRKTNIFFAFLLIASMVASCSLSMAIPSVTMEAEAASDHAYRYFYGQLQPNAKKIYDAMYEMYSTGVFEKDEDYCISDHGYVTESQLASFASGDQQLLEDYGAARDAFVNDYPDCFYVDFSLLTVRVTQDAQKNLKGYLGKGRSTTYLQKGFTANNVKERIEAYEAGVQEIIKKAESVEAKETDNETVKKVEAVHDHLVKNMIYHFENQVKDKKCNARTAYDGIVCGEGVCEAYTRSFKAVLDRLGIPCVCVTGVYRPDDKTNESHIWNAVQIDGKWYAVDVTHDDPTNKEWIEKNSGHETKENFLIGQLELSADHFESPNMSSVKFGFDYPEIELNKYTEEYMAETGDPDLKVKVVKESFFDDWSDFGESDDGGIYCISYRGKNYTENAADGYYLLAKYYTYAPGTDTWEVSDWGYLDPECYVYGGSPDQIKDFEPDEEVEGMGKVFRLALPMVKKAQFAVTTVAPSFKHMSGDEKTYEIIFNRGLYYKGNPALLHTVSKEIENQWGDYVAPPYTTKLTPYQAGQLMIGSTYHMEWTFDDKLIPNGTEEFDVELKETTSSGGDAGSSTGKQFSKIENEKRTGDSTIEFDFTPSKQFADDCCFYTFQIRGLMGEKSLKAPIPVTYCASYPCSAYAYQSQGFDWNVYGKPQLLESTDLSTNEWTDADGEKVDITEQLSHRLTLVTTSTNPGEEDQLKDVIGDSEYAGDFKKATVTNTYNIHLSLCKAMIVRTGQGVRVSVGFPAGTSYEDFAESGRLEFKAYHYIVDPETNLLTGEVEEIPITVTPLGLIITVDSFSPFAITAIPGSGEAPKNKTLVVACGENGKITDEDGAVMEGADGIIEFEPSTEKTFTVSADDEYDIDKIEVNGENKQTENGNKQQITISYNDLPEVSNFLNAEMIAASVLEEEESRGETHVFGDLLPASVTVPQTTYILEPGDELYIQPDVDLHNEEAEAEYKWYKDGAAKDGMTSKDLHIESVSADDAGTYKLYVKNKLSGDFVETYSEEIKVVVQDTQLTVPSSLNLKMGESYQFKNVVTPEGKEVTFESDANDIVGVSEDGTLTLKQVGDAKITVRAGSKSADCNVTVQKPDAAAIVLNAKDIKMNIGEKRTLTVDSVLPEGAEKSDIVWSAEENEGGVISVDPDSGEVTANKGGTAAVKATMNGSIAATCQVSVRGSLQSVRLNHDSIEMKVGGSQLLNVLPTPDDAYVGTVAWDSTNKASVTVDETGRVTATKVPGEADVTATVKGVGGDAGEQVLTCHVKVLKEPVTSFNFARVTNHNDVYVGKTATIYKVSNIGPSGATYTDVTWSTTTPEIISVNPKTGAITGLREGRGTVKATVDEMSKEGDVNVKKIPVSTVTINHETLNLTEGQEADLTADVQPDDATYRDVTWTSDASNVADVDGHGHVTAKEPGRAVIKATADGVEGTCTVYVTKAARPLESISLDTESLKLKPEGTHTFTLSVHPVGAEHGTPQWSVDHRNIAEITQDGKLTAKAIGEAKVTVRVDDKEATCNVTVEKEPVQSVVLSDSTLSLGEGTSHKLTAQVHPTNASHKDVVWSSEDKGIANVDQEGTVTAVKAGETKIYATADGVSGVCTVSVHKVVKPLSSITLDTENLTLMATETHDFKLAYHPGDADHSDPVWAIDHNDIAEITQDGHLTAKAVGDATVTVTVDGHEAKCHVTVEKLPVERIELSRTDVEIAKGQDADVSAAVFPEKATYPEITWKSDDDGIATVENGLITGVEAGQTIIRATADGVEAECNVTVLAEAVPVDSVSLDVPELTLNAGEGHTFTLTVNPAHATYSHISWESDNEEVAAVDEFGNVTAKKPGVARITVTVDGQSFECQVTVNAIPVSRVELNQAKATMKTGEVLALIAKITPDNATDQTITWKSSNEEVAAVDDTGTVTAMMHGTATITATAGEESATCEITVERANASAIELSWEEADMTEGEILPLEAAIYPADAAGCKITWSSSNEEVASVDENGVVTALKLGEAVITAIADDVAAQCKITVTAKPEEPDDQEGQGSGNESGNTGDTGNTSGNTGDSGSTSGDTGSTGGNTENNRSANSKDDTGTDKNVEKSSGTKSVKSGKSNGSRSGSYSGSGALYSGNGKGVQTGDDNFLLLSLITGLACFGLGTIFIRRKKQ